MSLLRQLLGRYFPELMIDVKSPRDIEAMRASGRLVAEIFARLGERIRPGVTLLELDRLASEYVRQHGAEPLYKGYKGNPPNHPPFPGVICTSVNNEICHGLPSRRVLREGDIVGIDIGLKYKGFCGDACVTFGVGKVSSAAERLLKVTEECLYEGIAVAHAGRSLSDIGLAIQTHAEKNGYSVVREWGGHGIGRKLHEDPSVPHVGPGGHGPKLRPGMTFTIEPMINAGRADCELLKDGWTVVTADGSLSAQFEHTIVVTSNGADILSKL